MWQKKIRTIRRFDSFDVSTISFESVGIEDVFVVAILRFFFNRLRSAFERRLVLLIFDNVCLLTKMAVICNGKMREREREREREMERERERWRERGRWREMGVCVSLCH